MEPLEWISALLGSGVGDAAGAAGGAALGDAGAGAGQSLASAASSAAGPGAGISPISSASPVISGASAPTSAAAPATKSWLEQGADAISNAQKSPLGKIIGAIKPAPAAQPQFQGGFHGPSLPATHAVAPVHAGSSYASIVGAKHTPTLGELLAQSPFGRLSSR